MISDCLPERCVWPTMLLNKFVRILQSFVLLYNPFVIVCSPAISPQQIFDNKGPT
jgi:hypothetical protein